MFINVWFVFLLLGRAFADFDWNERTPLDDYVWRDDGLFDYTEIDVFYQDGVTIYAYNMTSQEWITDDYTDRSIWTHYLAVAIPDNLGIYNAAHLFIEGGDMGEDLDMDTGRMNHTADFARDVGCVAALVRQNPNQPMNFFDEPDRPVGRTEDGIIAHTWRHYIEWPEENPPMDIVIQNPMTKVARMAVDAMIEIAKEKNDNINIEKIMPAGFSKRGWVAWLLACVDPRVFATAPIVFDLLNWHESLHHHNQAYGGWSWAFFAYWAENVSTYIDHPRASEIFDEMAIDPLMYNSRLANIPKLVQGGTGDEFFLPDDSHYYYDDLLGVKYLCLQENLSHNLGRPNPDRTDDNLKTFFLAALQDDFDWPQMNWTRTEDADFGTLEMWTDRPVVEAHAYWADTTDVICQEERNRTEQGDVCRRDFRERSLVSETGIQWIEVPFDVRVDEMYFSLTLPNRDPEVGYRGMLFQASFDGVRTGDILDVTTEIQILPDQFPFDRCLTPEECQGVLK